MSSVVVISPDQLTVLVEAAVTRALAAHAARAEPVGSVSDYLTVAEAATLLKCSAKTVRRRIACGRLTATRAEAGSSRVLVERRSIERLLGAGRR